MAVTCDLNWGSGPVRRGAWVNLDRNPMWEPTILNDTTTDPIPLRDSSVTRIVANHSLQMVGWHDLAGVLAEWRRVLVPSGVVRVLVPDVVTAFRKAMLGDASWFPIADDVCPTMGAKLSAYLTWWSEARVCHTDESVAHHLGAAGFVRIERAEFGVSRLDPTQRVAELDSRQYESLILEAVAP